MRNLYGIEKTDHGWLVKRGDYVIAIRDRESSAQSIADRHNNRVRKYPDGVEPGYVSNLNNLEIIKSTRHD